ncbi:MAG: sodium-dependent transporter [Candidatus Nitrohelix vancouverensis]|uniref:Transporter n=1 Tax=Candidatus Nitrohelix vancouverensis TaxID=2705534 RepID=A0A7T0C0V3_9BACT|nr:MAG: sodium-dependent transporter [Candidatus Nitrohelix vancouverensis]
MSKPRKSIHGEWSSRFTFILAATGSAIGLGNIWKFPYIAGENGGGAFVFVFLICVLVLGLPLIIAEVAIGRYGRQNPINSISNIVEENKSHPMWAVTGWLCLLSGFIIFSFYSVISGWVFSYGLQMGLGTFQNISPDDSIKIFNQFLSQPWTLLFWHSLFSLLTLLVVAKGVQTGIEKAVEILMPVLLILILTLLAYALSTGKFMEGLRFMFDFDFSKLTGESILIAMGQAFFTLSLASGAMMIYGSYLPRGISIPKACFMIAAADTAIAILAGLAIFPIVFAHGLEPASGPGLIFQTLPVAFGNMFGGQVFGALFFMLLLLAAFTSAISMIEATVAWLVENHDMTRNKASLLGGLGAWLLGLGTLLSFNLWSGKTLFGKNFFENIDYLVTNIMMPLGGILIALFASWVMSKHSILNELGIKEGPGFWVWRVSAGLIAPVLVLLVFFHSIEFF